MSKSEEIKLSTSKEACRQTPLTALDCGRNQTMDVLELLPRLRRNDGLQLGTVSQISPFSPLS